MSSKKKISCFTALLALCMCCVIGIKASAGSVAVTVKPDIQGEAVNVTIAGEKWDGQNVSLVLYIPGYDATAKNLAANAGYISYVGQVKVSGQTQVKIPLKGKVEKGLYTLVLGAKSGKVTKTFSFYPENTPVPTATPLAKQGGNVTPSPTQKNTSKVSVKKPSIKVKAGKKSATISWKKDSKAKGYKVYMATKKKGKYKVVATIKKNKTVKVTVKKLKKGKRYYFKVAAYQIIQNKKVTGKASAVKSVKIK